MSINTQDIIKIKSNTIGLDQNVDLIAKFTENTWQINRGFSEKKRDTAQGKNAELAVIEYLHKFSDLIYIPYDDFRTDSFEKHAPFDGIIFHKSNSDSEIKKCIDLINNEIEISSIGTITKSLRKLLYSKGIRCVEIKSTKVSNKRYDSKGNVVLEEILEDDFLTYPFFARSGFYTTNSYMFLAKSRLRIPGYLNLDELKPLVIQNEIDESSDLFIRVYVSDSHYYLIGYMTKEQLFHDAEIKKMIKVGKSKNALYFAKSLKLGNPMKEIYKIFN